MTRAAGSRALAAALIAGCAGLLPFVGHDLGGSGGVVPAVLAVLTLCDLLAAGLLAARFTTRGGAAPLTLAGAYLLAGLLAAAHALVLPGGWTDTGLFRDGAQLAPWLWGAGRATLLAGIALALWGGPARVRRALGAPTLDRRQAIALAGVGVAVAAIAVVCGLAAAAAALPDVMDGDELTAFGRTLAPSVLAVGLGALVVVGRRARREELERRLLTAVVCLLAGIALVTVAGQRFTVGWYTASALELAAALLVLVTLLAAAEVGSGAGPADVGAGARDPLTGVLTRGATLLAAEHLHRSRSPGAPLALALVDVDALRAIGDRHGPLAADAVLATVARRLRDDLRDVDVLGRAGEEGFVVAMPGADAEGATQAIDRAVATIREQPVGTWAHAVRTTASAGIAMVGEGDGAVARALDEADRALNQAKAGGRDQVVTPARAQVLQLRRPAGAAPQQG